MHLMVWKVLCRIATSREQDAVAVMQLPICILILLDRPAASLEPYPWDLAHVAGGKAQLHSGHIKTLVHVMV